MFNIRVLAVDDRCIAASIIKGVSYEPCARRASARALVGFIRDMFPKATDETGFSRTFLDELTKYVMDVTHSGVTNSEKARAKFFSLIVNDRKQAQDFVRILNAGVAQAQDVTYVAGSTADVYSETRSPLELQFQAMANAVIIEVLESLLVEFAKYTSKKL